VNVKGGSPMSVNLISAWSPVEIRMSKDGPAVTEEILAFMNVLEDPIPLANLGSGQRMDRVAQIRHRRFTHLLLLRNGRYLELACLLLGKCERRLLGLLGIRLAIYTVPISRQQKARDAGRKPSSPNCPRRNALQLEMCDFSNAEILSSVERDDRGGFCDIYPN